MRISREVKVWKNPGISFQQDGKAPFDTKIGPYYELGKTEARNRSKEIKLALDMLTEFDWNKPDEVLSVTPKWNEDVQYCKCTG